MLALIGRDVTLLKTADKVFLALDDYLNAYISKRFDSLKIKTLEGMAGYDSLNLEEYEGIVNCMPRKGIKPAGALKIDKSDSFYITDEHFMTSVKGVYAVGDVNGRSIYAHAALSPGAGSSKSYPWDYRNHGDGEGAADSLH
ncbi:MAG: hypothetical protein R2758_07205 [Bacteroidales bacterium]